MTTDKNSSPVTVPMWWDGGNRAITARDSIGERPVTLATVKPKPGPIIPSDRRHLYPQECTNG